MVAGLDGPAEVKEKERKRDGASPKSSSRRISNAGQSQNLVLKILTTKLDESKTFGENLIFILNRLSESVPDYLQSRSTLELMAPTQTRAATSRKPKTFAFHCSFSSCCIYCSVPPRPRNTSIRMIFESSSTCSYGNSWIYPKRAKG